MTASPPPRPDFLDSPALPKIMRAMSRANVWLYRKTNGYIGGTWRVGSAFPRGVPVCLLTTIGRKSGERRTTPLLFLLDGDRVVLVGSQGGMPRHPQWFSNLVQEPRVTVQIRGDEREMLARVADTSERARLWPRLVSLYRDFATYQAWTERTIPVVVCEPCPEQ